MNKKHKTIKTNTQLIHEIEVNNKELLMKNNYKSEFRSICVKLMWLWFLGNSFYNLSLSLTNVSSANTLSNSSIIFIIFFRKFVFGSKITVIKILSTLLVVTGLGFVIWLDSSIIANDKYQFDNKKQSFAGNNIYLLF